MQVLQSFKNSPVSGLTFIESYRSTGFHELVNRYHSVVVCVHFLHHQHSKLYTGEYSVSLNVGQLHYARAILLTFY